MKRGPSPYRFRKDAKLTPLYPLERLRHMLELELCLSAADIVCASKVGAAYMQITAAKEKREPPSCVSKYS